MFEIIYLNIYFYFQEPQDTVLSQNLDHMPNIPSLEHQLVLGEYEYISLVRFLGKTKPHCAKKNCTNLFL